MKNRFSRKQIDELADRLAGWRVKRVSIEFENEAERHRIVRLRDPRIRYYEQKKEDWLHDTNFNENCDCEECKLNRVEPEDCHYCNNGCGGGDEGCIPSCKYYPQEGLQTLEGQIAHKGTTEYDRLLQEWRDYCRRVNARKRFKR